MKMKGSIAVFAVAAAFAGSGAASQSIDSCRNAIGWWTVITSGVTGATLAIQDNTDEFIKKAGTKMVQSCTVPKRKGISTTLDGPMAVDECSLYNELAAADDKLSVGKAGDAYLKLSGAVSKIDTLTGQGKLSVAGQAAIRPTAVAAQLCAQALIGQ